MKQLLIRNDRITPARANWSRPVGVEYQFKTRVFASRDGSEQREALWQRPNIALKFTTLLSRAGISRMHLDMKPGMEVPLAVRAEWSQARLGAPASSGSSALVLDRLLPGAVAGAKVIVTTDTHEDLYTLSAVNHPVLTLLEPTERAYSDGTRVHLAFTTRAPEDVEFTAQAEAVWTGNMRFDVLQGTFQEPVTSADDTFEGRELLLARPNWLKAPKIAFGQRREVLDPGLGLDFTQAPETSDFMQFSAGYVGLNRTQAEALVGFFLRQRGRRNSFWMPLWTRDVVPSETALVAANEFQIDGPDFRGAYDASPMWNTLIAIWADGSHQINRITQLSGASDTTVECADDWDEPIVPETRVYWLPRWRFDTDKLDVRWRTDTVAETQLAFRTLTNEPIQEV